MTGSDPTEAMREAARQVLGDLMRGLVSNATAAPRVDGQANDAPNPNGHTEHAPDGNGHSSHVRDVAVPAHRIGQAGNDASDRPSPTSGDAPIVPQVPAPPVAAVLRPSTWSGPAVPGELIGDRPPEPVQDQQRQRSGGPSSSPARLAAGSAGRPRLPAAAGTSSDGRVETVTIDSDDDLERFVRALVGRLENPRDRQAIRVGRLRFALRRSTAAVAVAAAHAAPDPQVAPARMVRGAVTERAVRAAAADGTRLVLAHGAVLTPLARDCARACGVEIEREPRC